MTTSTALFDPTAAPTTTDATALHALPFAAGLRELCRLLPIPILIVDAHDVVVAANRALLHAADLPADTDLTGARADTARLAELGLVARPLSIGGACLTVLTAAATGGPRPRAGLEATFLHDLMNTAGGVRGLTGVMVEAEPWEVPRITAAVHGMAERMVTEIRALRDLLAAEDGELVLQPRSFAADEALHGVAARYGCHPLARGRRLTVAPGDAGAVTTDPLLLGRILDNLVKNALEATVKGGTVTVAATRTGEEVRFAVHNPGQIPAKVRPHLFKRAFSTRGKGRGLGAYGVKLLTENYLRGRVAFTSDAARGTTFTVSLPAGGL